jgi:hypothetical protein
MVSGFMWHYVTLGDLDKRLVGWRLHASQRRHSFASGFHG